MCLRLTENFQEETEKFRNSSKILIGYKLLQKINGQNFESVYEHFPYRLNEIAKSNRFSINLDEIEIRYLEIVYGLHFYINIEKNYFCNKKNKICASLYLTMNFCKKRIIKCEYSFNYVWGKFEILPENLVATGIFRKYQSFVATEAKFVEVIEEI